MQSKCGHLSTISNEVDPVALTGLVIPGGGADKLRTSDGNFVSSFVERHQHFTGDQASGFSSVAATQSTCDCLSTVLNESFNATWSCKWCLSASFMCFLRSRTSCLLLQESFCEVGVSTDELHTIAWFFPYKRWNNLLLV